MRYRHGMKISTMSKERPRLQKVADNAFSDFTNIPRGSESTSNLSHILSNENPVADNAFHAFNALVLKKQF
jgi:hypothetical protein